MPLNSPKRPTYWNSTSGFDFDHIIAIDMSFCTSLRNFIPMGPPSAEKNNVMSIFKMADLSHCGFYGSNNGLFEKPNYITFYKSSIDTITQTPIDTRHHKIQDGGSPPSWILGVPYNRFFEKPNYITSYRSTITIDIIALNCLVSRKSRFCILESTSKMADLRHLGF